MFAKTYLLLAFLSVSVQAAQIEFVSRELFRVPFGSARNALGAKVEDGNFLIPRDFTIDTSGHIYIYDSNKHRIVRFSESGAFQMSIEYPATARQVFAHADAAQNLWLLISDPARGLYYGVYDTRGKPLKEGLFSQFNKFRLHVDDDGVLHVIVSSDKNPGRVQTYLFDQESLLMKKENIAPPPEGHHRVRQSGKDYFIDPVPGAAKSDAEHIMQITDERRRTVASIQGRVLYVTEEGDVYTRVGACDLNIYDVGGSLKGKISLPGLPASCASIRYDLSGNLYQLDVIPDAHGKYSPDMPGMRLLRWERR